jgi:hypothetical protein
MRCVHLRWRVLRDEHVHRVVKELHHHEVGMRMRIHDEPELRLPFEDALADLRARLVRDEELDLRMRAEERRHEVRQEVRTEGFVASDDERSFVFGLEPFDALLGALEHHEDVVRMTKELFAGRRQPNAAALANEQRRLELLFEVLHRDGQRRLRDVQGLRRRGHRTALGNRREIPQVAQVHAPRLREMTRKMGSYAEPMGPIENR